MVASIVHCNYSHRQKQWPHCTTSIWQLLFKCSFGVGSCKGRLLSQCVKLGLLFLTPGTKLHQLKTLGCVPMNTSSFSWLPLVGVWRDANWLYGCDETHFARRACFRSYHEFVADSIHSDRYKRLDVNLVRNPHKTTTDKVAVGLVCRCRWRRSCRSLLLSIVHASFVNCTFLRSPCMLQHAFIHFIINSMSHSLRLPSNLSIHPSFHWSFVYLPTTVYWFVDWLDLTTIIHLFINIGLSLKLILIISNNCCGHPIFGQGSIPWQLTMENIMTMTNKPSRAF